MTKMQPYLAVHDADAALAFYAEAFGAERTLLLRDPDGRVGHAELRIPGVGSFALASEWPEMDLVGPKSRGGTTVSIDLDVEDCDAFTERASKAGATLEREPADQFYGYRSAVLVDPFGHRWMVGQKIETLTQEEMQRRYNALVTE